MSGIYYTPEDIDGTKTTASALPITKTLYPQSPERIYHETADGRNLADVLDENRDLGDERDSYLRMLGRLLALIISADWHYCEEAGWDRHVADAEAIVIGDRARIRNLEDERIWLMTALSVARQVLAAPEIAACLSPIQRVAVERIEAGATEQPMTAKQRAAVDREPYRPSAS